MSRKWTASQEASMSLSGRAVLVSAAAGSGKTSVLTERIIRRLTDEKNPADISRLLVVTFTRAAAAELKSRIATALGEALSQNPGNRRLAGQLLALGSAQISTIDSFFQKIVRNHFEQLELPATFRIADESEILPICTEIMEELIEDFYLRYNTKDKSEALFDQIENNRFAIAMDHLLSNRSDGKLNALLLDFFKQFEAYPDGIERLKQSAEALRHAAKSDFMCSSYGTTLSNYLKELFDGYRAELERLQQELAFDSDIEKKCAPLISTDIAYCDAMLCSLEKMNYTALRNTAFSFIVGRFPSIRNKPAQVSDYQNFRAVFRKEIASKVQAKLEWPEELLSVQLLQTAELCDMLYFLFSEYETRLLTEKKARGILEYRDIRSMLYRLLTDRDGSSSALAQELAGQYDEVYIDEYQDVDMLQDRIFALIGDNRRFMVGDIKQSIYGFRGSEPSIFSSYRRSMPLYTDSEANGENGVCVFMSENFRCNRPIIDFANSVCGFLFSACEKSVGYRPQDDLVYAKSSEHSETDAPPVQVAIFDNGIAVKNEEETESNGPAEAVWVAAEIARLLREETLDNGKAVTPSDIAILVRTKAHGKKFAGELERLGIPVTTESAKDFLHEPLMTDLLNLLRAIDNPYRDIPLSEFLISPMGGFTLEEISLIRQSANDSKSLFYALCNRADGTDALSEKAAAVTAWLEGLRAQAGILPADRFLRLLYLEERLKPFENDSVLLFLYEQARIYQRSSWCGLYGFLSHIDKLLNGKQLTTGGFEKSEQAVAVMTIHHSKGLEFPVVFLSSCGAPFNRADMREKLLYHRELGCASKLYNRETGEQQTTVLREIAKQVIDGEQTEESIRTLYVALTRARERLYVTGTLSGKWENAIVNASIVKRGNRSAILSCNSYLSWILAAQQDAALHRRQFSCTFRHILPEAVPQPFASQLQTPLPEPVMFQREPDAQALHYAKIAEKQKTFAYPLSFLHGLPTKAAASKLAPNLLDILDTEDNEESALTAQIELMRTVTPTFDELLLEQSQPKATEIGTATHAFLEFCNFDLLFRYGIEKERDRLVQSNFLSPAVAKIIHTKQLERFLSSDLAEWIRQATKIYREQKFSLFVPFSGLTENPKRAEELKTQNLFVQGSIDLLLEMPNGALYLIDYKTDRILEEEKQNRAKLTERMQMQHGTQLACYAEAVKKLFGRMPSKTAIYSLPLGEVLEIPLSPFL